MTSKPVIGALSITMAGLMFAIMGCLIKKLSITLNNEMVVFSRNLCVLTILLPRLFFKKTRKDLITVNIRLHLIRSLSGLTAMYLYFYTISKMHLAEAVMLSYTSPFFIPFVAFFWLKEPIYKKLIFASIAGFIGILLILKPGTSVFNHNGIYGILAAMFASIAMVSIRRMHETEPTLRIVFYYTTIAAAISLFPALLTWKTPDISQLSIIILMGATAFMGQFFVTRGYLMAPSAQVGPFTYTTILFATLIGYFFLNEVFDLQSLAGGVIIIIAGIIAVRS